MKKVYYMLIAVIIIMLSSCSEGDAAGASSESGGGQGGSMARFSIVKDYLYTLNGWNLQLFSLADPKTPTSWNRVSVAWDIETVFPYKDALFIGAESGMYIYDITNPAYPRFKSEFTHARSCDPVVVQDNIAYVTLRSGTRCWGTTDELEIINVEDLEYPRLLSSYPMHNPHGLSVRDSLLFICDGDAGVKCFNAEDPHNLKLIQHITGINSYDVIQKDSLLIVIAEEGLYQYNLNTRPFAQLSHIPVGAKKN